MNEIDYSKISSIQELKLAQAALAPQLRRASKKASGNAVRTFNKARGYYTPSRIIGMGASRFVKKINWLEIGLTVIQAIALGRKMRRKK